MSKTFAQGHYGSMPSYDIRKQYEITPQIFDNSTRDQVRNHMRSVLSSSEADPSSIEFGDNRRDFHSQQQLNLREGGDRYNTTVYAPDQFLEDNSPEQRDVTGAPLVQNLQNISKIYGSRQVLHSDADTSIPDTQIPTLQLTAKRQMTDQLAKGRYRIFDESIDNRASVRNYKMVSSMVQGNTDDERIPNGVADLQTRNVNVQTLMNTLIPAGYRYTIPDGVAPIADYSVRNWNKPLEQKVQNSISYYNTPTHETLVHRDGILIPTSLAKVIGELQMTKGAEFKKLGHFDPSNLKDATVVLPSKYTTIQNNINSEYIRQYVHTDIGNRALSETTAANTPAHEQFTDVPSRMLYAMSLINKQALTNDTKSATPHSIGVSAESKHASNKFYQQTNDYKIIDKSDLESKNIQFVQDHNTRILLNTAQSESAHRNKKEIAIINYSRWNTPNNHMNQSLVEKLQIASKQYVSNVKSAQRQQQYTQSSVYDQGGERTATSATYNLDNATQDRAHLANPHSTLTSKTSIIKKNLDHTTTEFNNPVRVKRYTGHSNRLQSGTSPVLSN
jgi:hypothetical protein